MCLRLSELRGTVLVVDDEAIIRGLIARWLTMNGYRAVQASSAAEAWDCLQLYEIDLVTLDISMPGESGLELLPRLTSRFPEVPVLMLTALGNSKTVIEAMTAGAYGYLIKPIQQDELVVQVMRGLQWRQLLVERRVYTQSLQEKVLEQTGIIRHAHEETIHRLVAATMCRDEETGAHIVRTGLYAQALARAAGCSTAEAEQIRLAAPMHDIGKIGIPDSILQKPGKLTADEFAVMKQHTTIGEAILAGSQSPILQLAREIALSHHERWDGAGYPHGLAGESIPMAARIVSIVDVFDALTHDRIYRPAYLESEALRIMTGEQGTQFDSGLLATFFTVLEEIRELASQNPDQVEDRLTARPVVAHSIDAILPLPTMNL